MRSERVYLNMTIEEARRLLLLAERGDMWEKEAAEGTEVDRTEDAESSYLVRRSLSECLDAAIRRHGLDQRGPRPGD